MHHMVLISSIEYLRIKQNRFKFYVNWIWVGLLINYSWIGIQHPSNSHYQLVILRYSALYNAKKFNYFSKIFKKKLTMLPYLPNSRVSQHHQTYSSNKSLFTWKIENLFCIWKQLMLRFPHLSFNNIFKLISNFSYEIPSILSITNSFLQ